MAIRRRQVLQFGGAGGLLAVLPWQAAGAAVAHLRHFVVPSPHGLRVGIDASVTAFAGDGLYLYPA